MKNFLLTLLVFLMANLAVNGQEIIKTKSIEQIEVKSPTLSHPEAKSVVSKKDSSVTIWLNCSPTEEYRLKQPQPLYILNIDKKQYKITGIEMIVNKVMTLIPVNYIQTIDIMKHDEAIETYGNDANNGVLIVEFKKQIEAVNQYQKKLNKYLIKTKN